MKIKHEKIRTVGVIANISDTIVVTGHSDGTICVWDTSRADPLLRSWQAHSVEPYYRTAWITTLLIVNDTTVASGAYDCHIKLWDISNGKCILDLNDTGYISALQLRGNEEIVSSSIYNSDRNRTVRVWNYHSGKNTATFIPDGKILGVNAGAHWRYPVNTIVLPNQKVAFTTQNEANGGRAIVIWDPETQIHAWYPFSHQEVITGLTNIGDELLSLSNDLTLKKWPSQFDESTKSYAKFTESYAMTHSGSVRMLDLHTAVCIGTNKISAYNISTGQCITVEGKPAFFHNATGCQDIWIKFSDSCLFKINMIQFLTFARTHKDTIHYFLLHQFFFFNNDASVRNAYIENFPRFNSFFIEKREKLEECRNFLSEKFLNQIEQIKETGDLLQSNSGSTNKTLRVALEKGCFISIEKMLNMNAPITDDILELALKKDRELHYYLNLRRKMDVLEKIDYQGVFGALKIILNYEVVPIQSLIDLIRIDPSVIHQIEKEADGNTLLHQLVIDKKLEPVKALLAAIYQAGCTKIDGFYFNIEAENKNGKTILALALAQSNSELIGAILLYNPNTNQAQQALLLTIDIPKIEHDKVERMIKTIQKQGQRADELQEGLEIATEELIETKMEVLKCKQSSAYLLGRLNMQEQQLQIQEQKLQMQQKMLEQLFQVIGVEPKLSIEQESRPQQANNPYILLAPSPSQRALTLVSEDFDKQLEIKKK